MNRTPGTQRSDGRLTEAEEQLLNEYIDGELGFFALRRAKKLLRLNRYAREYVEGVSRVTERAREWADAGQRSDVDLWDRIERRIAEEERAAVFLGERPGVEPVWRMWLRGASWAVPGAAVAALVTFIALRSERIDFPGGFSQIASTARQEVEEPAFAVQPQLVEAPPQMLAQSKRRELSPVEVGWMRSAGRVSMLQSRDGNPAIIWIRRNNRGPVGAPLPQRSLTARVPQAIEVSGR